MFIYSELFVLLPYFFCYYKHIPILSGRQREEFFLLWQMPVANSINFLSIEIHKVVTNQLKCVILCQGITPPHQLYYRLLLLLDTDKKESMHIFSQLEEASAWYISSPQRRKANIQLSRLLEMTGWK